MIWRCFGRCWTPFGPNHSNFFAVVDYSRGLLVWAAPPARAHSGMPGSLKTPRGPVEGLDVRRAQRIAPILLLWQNLNETDRMSRSTDAPPSRPNCRQGSRGAGGTNFISGGHFCAKHLYSTGWPKLGLGYLCISWVFMNERRGCDGSG